ncbi:TPA: oligosaccharyl transferase, archaeosortase A system-associated [Methanosarcinaceae archaeon]|nr:oligosaccharyl transferase, archaeosortase A system-associated [Methanosarcinaceae archaeon]
MRSPESKKSAHNSKLGIISLIAIISAAFLMRMLSYTAVTANGRITPVGFDAFYHMRRIFYTTSNFPEYIRFDSYLNYPSGFEIGWPPLYDLLGAGLALVLGAGNPDTHTVELAGALLPVLLGTLTVIPVYVAASALFNRKIGVFSAAIFAVIPVHVYTSQFGMVDHHVAEVLLSTAAFAFFILALKAARDAGLSFAALKNLPSERKLALPVVFSVCSGACFALLVYTWIGAPILIGFIALYFFLQSVLDLKAGRKSDYLVICSASSLLTVLLLSAPLCIGVARPGLELSAMFLSWFQVCYVLALLAGVLLLGAFSAYIASRKLDWWYYPALTLFAFGAGLFILRSFSGESYDFVIEGLKYFSGKGGILSSISEAGPLFFTTNGEFSLAAVIGNFGLGFPAALAAIFLLGLEWRGEKFLPERVFFLLWTGFAAYLAISQRRFSYLFSVNVVILTAYLLMVLFESLGVENEVKKLFRTGIKTGNLPEPNPDTGKNPKAKRKVKGKAKENSKAETKQKAKAARKSKSLLAASKPDYFKLVSALILIGIIFVPCIGIVAGFSKQAVLIDEDWQDSLQWLETSTPATSHYTEPSKTPEYGVLSWWDYGNWIVYLAKRPAVSNNFQTGVEDSALFFTSGSEEQAKSVLDRLNVKYVITDSKMIEGKFRYIAELAGKNIEDYYEFRKIQSETGYQTTVILKEELKATELYKLHQLDGASLGNLRLVHESVRSTADGNKAGDGNTVKVFEYVPGAKLSGTSAPNQTVKAELELSSNTGRSFLYYNTATADENGFFEIAVPYPTENTGNANEAGKGNEVAAGDGGVTAATTSGYTLTAGENSTRTGIRVKESDVLNGNRIEIEFS